MKIDQFERGLNQAWHDALFDNKVTVVEVTLFPNQDRRHDERHLLGLANSVIEKLEKLRGTIRFSFLGASKKTENCFPQLAISCETRDDVLKMHGALAGHFVEPMTSGYNIRYVELK